MKRIALTLLSVPLTVLAFGCNKDGGAPPKTADTTGTVAIVDLDKVAKAMGWTDEMQKNLEQTKGSASEQLRSAIKPVVDALTTKRDEIAKAANLSAGQITELNNAKSRDDLVKLGLSTKQIDDLAVAYANASNEEARANQLLNQIFERQRAAIIQKYREAVTPSVRRVAIASNKTVVLMPTTEVLYSDPAADISDKVVDDLQHTNAGKVELPPLPDLRVPIPSSTTKPK